jgi:hypothetical protein
MYSTCLFCHSSLGANEVVEALAGELALLVEAWRAAEEIAAIADSLLISDTVRDAEVRLRKRVPPIDA